MDCPVCEKTGLTRKTLERDLVTYSCSKCQGHVINANDYAEWLKRQGEIKPEKPFSDITLIVHDVDAAKLCPCCSRLMVKYKVGHGLDFKIDRCGGCGAVWFDTNEWEAMQARNLHDEIGSVFTAAWQAGVREEQEARSMETIYARKFGEEDYAQLKEIREWIDKHPMRQAILHFLNDESPFKA